MSERPPVSVVVPFAGDAAAAATALAMLRSLDVRPGDQLILADNSGTVAADAAAVTVVRASRERSPAHARNAGAARAQADWILFLDADTRPPPDLLDRYFAAGPIAPDVAVLVGQVLPVPGGRTLAERYGAARNFLDQRAHLAHPYRPRASAANLLVRRRAFEIVDGFREGLRAAEDTDFCWRLAPLAWRLELREDAAVEHHYRASIRELRRQWRAYAAGRAWLARRYPGFDPEPAIERALRRAAARIPALQRAGLAGGPQAAGRQQRPDPGYRRAPAPGGADRLERAQFLALDVLLAFDELIGLRHSNDADR